MPKLKIDTKEPDVVAYTFRKKVGFGLGYSKEDLKFIRENIATMKLTEMASHLGRKFDTLRIKVSRMGLSEQRLYSFKAFTKEEVNFLLENGNKLTLAELATQTGRSFDSISKKLWLLGKKAANPRGFERLTDSEIKYLKKNYQKMTMSKLAEKLNKSNSAISKKLEKLGLHNPKLYRKRKSKDIN
jgi:hypothetical protein